MPVWVIVTVQISLFVEQKIKQKWGPLVKYYSAVREATGRTHRAGNLKHPVRRRGCIQTRHQDRAGGEQDAQQEQLIVGSAARPQQPGGRQRASHVHRERERTHTRGSHTHTHTNRPVFVADEGAAEDEQGDDDGHSCSWWNYDVQKEADVTVLQTDQGLVSGWSLACRKNRTISIWLLVQVATTKTANLFLFFKNYYNYY